VTIHLPLLTSLQVYRSRELWPKGVTEAGLEPSRGVFSILYLFSSPNSLEVEHQSCKLEVLSSILSLGSVFIRGEG
jgi:hypothetical protein